jgi:tRNA (cmo5U34)-methyltransferase
MEESSSANPDFWRMSKSYKKMLFLPRGTNSRILTLCRVCGSGMNKEFQGKSTVAEIRARFDNDVERFSRLDTGQAATIDAPLAMSLITQAAVSCTPVITRVLDIGCGAGNNTLKLREAYGRDFACDLLDLSPAMLARARERVAAVNSAEVRLFETDFRSAELQAGRYDVVLAAAVLHHLREDDDWYNAFRKIYEILAPGGSVWITDLVSHENQAIQHMMWERYGDYLVSLGGEEYREKVFAYIEKEDSPRPVPYQLDLLRQVGFSNVELLHKNSCFAAFGAIKAPDSR